jgi:probable addiction module antidote protein
MSEQKPPNLRNFRDNPEAVAEHLTKAFATNDVGIIVRAINEIMRAQNVVALAKNAGLRRDRLYKSFGGKIDPQLGRTIALFAALDVQIVVKPLTPKEKPPRPKLGRPRKSTPA